MGRWTLVRGAGGPSASGPSVRRPAGPFAFGTNCSGGAFSPGFERTGGSLSRLPRDRSGRAFAFGPSAGGSFRAFRTVAPEGPRLRADCRRASGRSIRRDLSLLRVRWTGGAFGADRSGGTFLARRSDGAFGAHWSPGRRDPRGRSDPSGPLGLRGRRALPADRAEGTGRAFRAIGPKGPGGPSGPIGPEGTGRAFRARSGQLAQEDRRCLQVHLSPVRQRHLAHRLRHGHRRSPRAPASPWAPLCPAHRLRPSTPPDRTLQSRRRLLGAASCPEAAAVTIGPREPDCQLKRRSQGRQGADLRTSRIAALARCAGAAMLLGAGVDRLAPRRAGHRGPSRGRIAQARQQIRATT